MLQNDGDLNVYDRPFANHHNNKGKRQVLMVSASEREVEGEISMQPEGELELNWMAQQVQGLFKFRNFYDHMVLAWSRG